MAKILNLDEVAPRAEKVLTFKGVQHKLVPPTVASFIEVTRKLEDLEKSGASVSEQIEYMIESIANSFPSMGKEQLKELNMDQLNAIFTFIREDAEKEADEAKEEAKK